MKFSLSRSALAGIGLVITDIGFFGLTNPNQVEPLLLIVGFGLVLVNLFFGLTLLQLVVSWYWPALAKLKSFRYGLFACLGSLLALQSIGQLTGRDLILVPLATLVLLGYFSYSKSSFLKPTL